MKKMVLAIAMLWVIALGFWIAYLLADNEDSKEYLDDSINKVGHALVFADNTEKSLDRVFETNSLFETGNYLVRTLELGGDSENEVADLWFYESKPEKGLEDHLVYISIKDKAYIHIDVERHPYIMFENCMVQLDDTAII